MTTKKKALQEIRPLTRDEHLLPTSLAGSRLFCVFD
jgi:hypothetical protein